MSNPIDTIQSDKLAKEAMTWWENNSDLIVEYATNIVTAIIILIVGWIFASLFCRSLRKLMDIKKVDSTIVLFVSNLTRYAILAFVVIAALSQLGIQTASFVAVIGAAGLAVGLALQGSLSNFAAGVLIIMFRPIKVSEFIEAAGTTGVVKEISIFSTILTTGDNKMIVVPNNAIISGNIINYSRMDTRRVDMEFGVAYGSDLKKTREVFADLIKKDTRILKDPEPQIVVGELAASSINFKVRVWVNNADYWGVYFDMQENVAEELARAGIEIPFPQVSVHMDK